MKTDCGNKIKKQELFKNYYYQNKFEEKVYDEINFENFLEEKDEKSYERYKKPKCNNIPKCLLTLSIIIIIFNIAGLYFSISRNEGYIKYKQLLEKNLTLIENQYPNENETKKLVAYLTRDESEGIDDDSCSYIEYSLSLCEGRHYENFCNKQRYKENKCNYMDHQVFLNKPFTCDLQNYKSNMCNEFQYLDNLNINENNKIKYFNYSIEISGKDYRFEKVWCKMGNYDIPILSSFLTFMVLFSILSIFDLYINKSTFIFGIKYYIALILYMIFYFIFRIYLILLLALFIFSTIVIYDLPTANIDDSFYNSQDEENKKSIILLWEYKKIFSYIYCGINFILFIFDLVLCFNDTILYKYLSFDFEKDHNFHIIRKVSIKIGKNNYDFEIIQNKNIYLKERRENEKIYFKEIMYNNNTLYLKFMNKGIKDQLGWIDYNYPIMNKGFEQLFFYLKVLIYTYILSNVISLTFHIKDSNFYNYYLHLFELGYQPYLYENLRKFAELQILFYNLIKYIFVIIGILVTFSLFKWTLYGGSSNAVLIWFSLFISIIVNLINLALSIISFLIFVYNITSLIIIGQDKISFVDQTEFEKLMYSIYFYAVLFVCILILLSIGIKFSMFLISVIYETKKLEKEEFPSEDIIKFKTLNNENYIFEALNIDNNILKQLFYIKERDESPISKGNQSNYLFLEQNQEQILGQKNKLELENFKNSYKNGLSRYILSIIIICLFSFAFIIGTLSNSMKNYKYYKEFREYLIISGKLLSYDYAFFDASLSMNQKQGLPSFTQLWCDYGNIESNIIISYLIFIILYLCFQIISFLIHKRIIKLDIKKGISYHLIIIINSIFFVVFMIFFPLLLFLFFYSIIIDISPFISDSNILSTVIKVDKNKYEKAWYERFLFPIINILLKLFIFIINCILSNHIKILIINYLSMNFKDGKDNNKKFEKNTFVVINNNPYNVKIISNKILYLKDMNLGTIYKFKLILIESITNGYVYVKLGNNSITDQISSSEWHYPELNFIFSQIATLCKLVYAILFISIPLFKCLIIEDFSYKSYVYSNKIMKKLGYKINKTKFNDIFVFYGDFENGVIKSRFSLYLISIFFILLFMLKRMLFGGFNSQIKSLISFIMSLIFVALNSVYIIIDLLMVLFEIFSIICIFDIEFYKDTSPIVKVFFQLSLNTIIFGISIRILVDSIKLSINIRDLRKELIKFNNVEEIGKKDDFPIQNEFKYLTLEGNVYPLKEVKSDKLQRYLYYSLDIDYRCNISSEQFNITEFDATQNDEIVKNDHLEDKTENRLKNNFYSIKN